jgi:hypothetical protein
MAAPNRLIRNVFCRDYKHMANPSLRSYLIDDPVDDSPTNDCDGSSHVRSYCCLRRRAVTRAVTGAVLRAAPEADRQLVYI